MSNALAIAAVTATLQNLLEQPLRDEFPDTNFSTTPPDRARNSNNGNQINLFLYQVEHSPAWRNTDLPWQTKPGETGQPPLALNLYYLITAYGQHENDRYSHRLLGRAMSILHDHAVLGRTEIQQATESELPHSDLHFQVERVRITPQPLSLDEMSKLWNTFQTQYRLSAAYQVSVVLIDSTRPVKTPLPVLQRGEGDTGLTTQPDMTQPLPPFPTLVAAEPKGNQPSAQLGKNLILRGYNLADGELELRFTHPHLEEPYKITQAIALRTETEIEVRLSDPAQPDPDIEPWPGPAGVYSVAAVVTEGERETITNEVPFALAPKIGDSEVRPENGEVIITITASPKVWPRQRVSLLLGDREIRPWAPEPTEEPVPTSEPPEPQERLVFRVKDIPPDTYLARLRVDGVDSLFVDHEAAPPVFIEDQRISIP